jgi:hypothetical protein
MAELLTLTTPIVPPTRISYTFARLTLDLEAQFIQAVVRGSDGVEVHGEWSGPTAVALMTALNVANLSTGTSLVKLVFQQLVAAGKLPAGTVSGTPQ